MVNQSIAIISQTEAIKIVKEYIKKVKALGVDVKKAFLFGSFARNHQTEWSDIDVALVGDDFVGFPLIDKTPFRRLHTTDEFMVIETHTFPTASLTNGDAFLNEVVLRTGIEINI